MRLVSVCFFRFFFTYRFFLCVFCVSFSYFNHVNLLCFSLSFVYFYLCILLLLSPFILPSFIILLFFAFYYFHFLPEYPFNTYWQPAITCPKWISGDMWFRFAPVNHLSSVTWLYLPSSLFSFPRSDIGNLSWYDIFFSLQINCPNIRFFPPKVYNLSMNIRFHIRTHFTFLAIFLFAAQIKGYNFISVDTL